MGTIAEIMHEQFKENYKEKIKESINNVDENVKSIEYIIDETVKDYSSELDRIMAEVYTNVVSIEYPAINTVEKYFLELSNCLYMMCEKSEKLGLYDSISKAKAQDTYNQKYLEHQHSNEGVVGAKKPTVAESQAISESAALYDKTVNELYSKAYKIIKAKVSAAETMVSALSKILSHRMQESQLTSMQTGRQLLNEGSPF